MWLCQFSDNISVILPDAEDSHVSKIESCLEESVHPAAKELYSVIDSRHFVLSLEEEVVEGVKVDISSSGPS